MSAQNDILEALRGAGLDEGLTAALALYGALVLDANRSFNLTGSKTPSDLVSHLLDSLSVREFVRESFIDVGSGAGLPGIPVALATRVPVTLIEANRKKAAFLARTLAALGLEGEVVNERAETAARRPQLREHFASGTARAISSAPAVAELLLPLIRIGGVAILQRGAIDAGERTALADAALVLGAELDAEHELAGDRRILILRKKTPTPLRFPRRPGIPEKRPLCT